MSRLRSSIMLFALACAFGVGVPCAGATDPFPTQGVVTLQSAHFMIHYVRDDKLPSVFITQEKAGEVLGMAERAYDLFTGTGQTPDGQHSKWGFPAPAVNTSGPSTGLIDISVDDFCGPIISYARGVTSPDGGLVPPYNIDPSIPVDSGGKWCRWDALLNSTPLGAAGEIHLTNKNGLSYHVIAHEVFHLIENQMAASADQWLREASAEWAAFSSQWLLTPTQADLGSNPDRTADCVGAECGDTELDKNGYPGWLLFEYLTERFPGARPSDIVKDVWTQAASAPNGITALSNVLTAHSTTVPNFYNDFATARLTGNFDPPSVNGLLPTAQASVNVGEESGAIPTTDVAVNHLAARYVKIVHGDPTNLRAPCYAASLTLNIAIPAGVTSAPYFYANTYGTAPVPFTVTGSTASLTLPDWNTCGASPDAYVSLPNDSWNPGLDGREFEIYGTVDVDTSTPASPAGPSGTRPSGPVIEAPLSTPAPSLTLYAPEILRVKASNPVLRFVVFSSGDGQLQAHLGPTNLGTSNLRAGNNDVRFRIPKSLVAALRKTSARNTLALTSLSPDGDYGDTLTRTVVIQPTPKKKKKTNHH